jgi:hypothetical protein
MTLGLFGTRETAFRLRGAYSFVGVALVLTFGTLVPLVQAASADNTFEVSVSLTSACEATNDDTQTVNFGNYSAFQGTAQSSNSVSLSFRCTRGYTPVSVAFDGGSGTGVLQGLHYALTAAAPTTETGSSATADSIGSADIITYVVSGTMPANQAGACALASCGPASQVRTLMITY